MSVSAKDELNALKLPTELLNEEACCKELLDKCTELQQTLATNSGSNSLVIGGETVCDDVSHLISNHAAFLANTKLVGPNEKRHNVPRYPTPCNLWIIGSVSSFGNRWQETGALKKHMIASDPKATKIQTKTGKTMLKSYDQHGLNIEARWERSLSLMPTGNLTNLQGIADTEAFELINLLSLSSFAILQFHTKVTHFARLVYWADAKLAKTDSDDQIEKWVQSVLSAEDTEQEREIEDVLTLSEITKLWKKFCNPDKGPKPGLEHPSNAAFRVMTKKADARNYRAETPLGPVQNPTDTVLSDKCKKLVHELGAGATAKFAEQLKPAAKEDFTDLTNFYRDEYIRRYIYETQADPESIDFGKDVDPEYERALKKMTDEYINMPDHCVVMSDMTSPPQFKGQISPDEAVFFTTVQKDMNTNAVLAVNVSFSVGLRKEYTNVKAIAIFANSRFIYQASLPDADSTLKMNSMATDLERFMSLKKRRTADVHDPAKQLKLNRNWEEDE